MYKLWIIKSAQRNIRSLPKNQIPHIVKDIQNLAKNPRSHQTKKLKGSKNAYRLRIGNYRILYTINDKNREVTVYRVNHRKDVYH